MAEILLLENPRKRKRRSKAARFKKGSKAAKAFMRKLRLRKGPGRLNPQRKRTAGGAKIVKHRPVFYGLKGKLGVRCPHKRLNPKRRRKSNSNLSFNSTRLIMAKKHRRHRRHNPPLKNIIGGVGNNLKTALFGAGGIAVNKFLSNKLAPMLKLDAKNKTLLELGSALFVLPLIAKMVKKPGAAMAANVAASVAIFDAAKGYLPKTVQSQLAGYDTPYQITDTPMYLPVASSDSLPLPLY